MAEVQRAVIDLDQELLDRISLVVAERQLLTIERDALKQELADKDAMFTEAIGRSKIERTLKGLREMRKDAKRLDFLEEYLTLPGVGQGWLFVEVYNGNVELMRVRNAGETLKTLRAAIDQQMTKRK